MFAQTTGWELSWVKKCNKTTQTAQTWTCVRRLECRAAQRAPMSVLTCALHQSLDYTESDGEVLRSLLLLCLVPCKRIDDTVFGKQTRREAKKVVTHHRSVTQRNRGHRYMRATSLLECAAVCVYTRSCLCFGDAVGGMWLSCASKCVPVCFSVHVQRKKLLHKH